MKYTSAEHVQTSFLDLYLGFITKGMTTWAQLHLYCSITWSNTLSRLRFAHQLKMKCILAVVSQQSAAKMSLCHLVQQFLCHNFLREEHFPFCFCEMQKHGEEGLEFSCIIEASCGRLPWLCNKTPLITMPASGYTEILATSLLNGKDFVDQSGM